MSANIYLRCDKCGKTETVYAGDLYSDNFDPTGFFATVTCLDCEVTR